MSGLLHNGDDVRLVFLVDWRVLKKGRVSTIYPLPSPFALQALLPADNLLIGVCESVSVLSHFTLVRGLFNPFFLLAVLFTCKPECNIGTAARRSKKCLSKVIFTTKDYTFWQSFAGQSKKCNLTSDPPQKPINLLRARWCLNYRQLSHVIVVPGK